MNAFPFLSATSLFSTLEYPGIHTGFSNESQTILEHIKFLAQCFDNCLGIENYHNSLLHMHVRLNMFAITNISHSDEKCFVCI